ncbi:IS110 family transposase [Streptomyces sp. RLA2-12]|nr:IS110 family transposase [Streptomyces sp. RLA2-12]
MVRDLVLELLGLHEKIHELDKLIEARFREHELAPVISSMPGIGPLLGAEFLAATGGDLSRFPGNVNGNLHRPRRYHRGLQRVFYRSAGNSA